MKISNEEKYKIKIKLDDIVRIDVLYFYIEQVNHQSFLL